VARRRAALAAGDDPPGDPIAGLLVAPGARVVVVASGYDPDAGDDPPPAPGNAVSSARGHDRQDPAIRAHYAKLAAQALRAYPEGKGAEIRERITPGALLAEIREAARSGRGCRDP
jgi:hypothetical protein